MFRKLFIALITLSAFSVFAENIEILDLDIIAYEDLIQKDPNALQTIRNALFEKGIVGVKGVPGYKESAFRFIERAREFSALPLSVKQAYAPDRSRGEYTGYEIGNEKFKRPDGTWVADDSKASYYAFVTEYENNVWPVECDLKTPFEEIGQIMFQTGKKVMEVIDLLGPKSPISSEGLIGLGRMLHYAKQSDETMENPFWCGAHFDHGPFTALLPAYYFANGKYVPEPEEAGLFVRVNDTFYKVISDDPDVILFQSGEFGQLVTDDAIKATQHRVHKAKGGIERFTMALFIVPADDTTIYSHSVLAEDSRYGASPGEACTYKHWGDSSYNRYLSTQLVSTQ